MKTLGLIGGISWYSTAGYYKMINELVHARLGGNNAAKILLYSVNYNDFKQLQYKNDWDSIETMLTSIAKTLETAGADCMMIGCNAAHLIADKLQKKITIPFLHIADATAEEIAKHGISKVALTGTKFTMESSFFTERLARKGIQTQIPGDEEREFIHRIILDELASGIINPETKTRFIDLIESLVKNGAEAVILGCTELGILISQSDVSAKIFDTTIIHCQKATEFVLSGPDISRGTNQEINAKNFQQDGRK